MTDEQPDEAQAEAAEERTAKLRAYLDAARRLGAIIQAQSGAPLEPEPGSELARLLFVVSFCWPPHQLSRPCRN